MNYCSDRCEQRAAAGASSYAPCPLLPDRRYAPEEVCLHCGWVVPLDRVVRSPLHELEEAA